MKPCGADAICGNGIGGVILLILVLFAGYGISCMLRKLP